MSENTENAEASNASAQAPVDDAPQGTGEVVGAAGGADTPDTLSEASAEDPGASPAASSTTIRVAPPVVSDVDYKGRRFTVFTTHGAIVHQVETHDAQVGVALSPGQYHVYVNNMDEADEERFGKPVNKVIEITGQGVEDFLIE